MLAEELVNTMLPVLRPSDSVGQAIDVMQDSGVGQLAMVEDEVFQGVFDEDLLLNIPNESLPLAHLPRQDTTAFATNYQHIYELISLANRHRLKIIPVLDREQDNSYAGSIVVNDMMSRFADLMGVQEIGAIIVLKITNRDYSMTEISRLVESNDVKIISSYYKGATMGQFDEATLTLKLNRTDVGALTATLERFGYNIEGVFGQSSIKDINSDRLGMLFRYLEV
jgi:acetoin utilization protein AcuB